MEAAAIEKANKTANMLMEKGKNPEATTNSGNQKSR
jgi:hypothetical protein